MPKTAVHAVKTNPGPAMHKIYICIIVCVRMKRAAVARTRTHNPKHFAPCAACHHLTLFRHRLDSSGTTRMGCSSGFILGVWEVKSGLGAFRFPRLLIEHGPSLYLLWLWGDQPMVLLSARPGTRCNGEGRGTADVSGSVRVCAGCG